MFLRTTLLLSLSVLLTGACAWAQGGRFRASGHWAPGFSGQSHRSGVNFQGRAVGVRHFGYAPRHIFRQNRLSFGSYRFNRFPHSYRYGFGYSPYLFGGYAGYGFPYGYNSYFGIPYGRFYGETPYDFYNGAPDGCDTRFSSLPFNCVPLYPQGPPAYDDSALGDVYSPQLLWENGPKYDAISPGAIGVQGNRETFPLPRYEARRVQTTLDGQAQPVAGVIAIGSGKHELVITSRPTTQHPR